MKGKSSIRNIRNGQPVSYEKAIIGQRQGLIAVYDYYTVWERWPTIQEENPPYGLKELVERQRRICDAHGVSLYEFLTATTSRYDAVWERLDCYGTTSVKESGAYDGSIAEAMQYRLDHPELYQEVSYAIH